MNPTHFRLQTIFREIFDQPGMQLSPEMSPSIFPEWDSVAMVQIVLATEHEFGVRFSTDEVASIKTVADLVKLIASKTG